MTAQTFINNALHLIGALESGGTPTTQESNDALDVLNQILSIWSAAGVTIPYIVIETFSLTGPASYTIGSGQTFNSTRPLAIRAAASISSNVHRGLEIIPAERYAAIGDKTRTGKLAEVLYYAVTAQTTGTVYLWPAPVTGGTLQLHSLKALTAIASLATAIALPDGYEMSLRAKLAATLAPEYGRPVSADVAAMAKEAFESISAMNGAVLGSPSSLTAPKKEQA